MGRWLVLLAGLLVLAGESAAAECGRDRVLTEYAAAVAAVDQGRAEAAEAGFRALALEGFAPAQRRLGELLRRQGGDSRTARETVEAYWWLAMAMRNGDRLARDGAFAVEGKLEMLARIDLDRKIEEWRPALSDCTRDLVRRRHDDGTADHSVGLNELVAGYWRPAPAPGTPDWVPQVGRYLLAIADAHPEFVPYVTAIGTVGVRALDAAALVEQPLSDGEPRLVLAQATVSRADPNQYPAVMAAIRDLVHRRADPPPVLRVDYRGRHLFLRSYGLNEAALALVKQALDLAEKLPPDLRALAAAPKRLVVEPLRPGEPKAAIATLEREQGAVRFSSLPGGHSAIDVVAGLVGAGRRLSSPDDKAAAEAAAQRAHDFLRRS